MRKLHQLYAWLFGYFWLPCPVCGRMFGGHEILYKDVAALITSEGRASCVCPNPECSAAAEARNAANGHPVFVRMS